MAAIAVDRDRITDFCRGHHIHHLSFFGSMLCDDFRPDSDIDVLVEFEPGREPGFIGLAGMEFELSELLGGRPVDMRTPEDLSRSFREEVVASAKLLYGYGDPVPAQPTLRHAG